jgi:hypothetical protein
MTKPIAPSQHLATDYLLGPLVAAAPDLLHFRDEKTATLLCRLIGGGLVVGSSMTNAKGSLVPLVPLTAHLAGDVANGLFALGAPLLFGFRNPRARNTFLALAAVSILAGTLTRTEE